MPHFTIAARGRNCYNQPRMKSPLLIRLLIPALLLGAVVGGIQMWLYINDLAQPVLTPINQAYSGYANLPKKAQGLHLAPFTFKGWDGGEMQAVLVTKEGEESSRQLTVIGDLTLHPAPDLHAIDYALVCVDWDHGICSSLPLAESLTAAGIPCVLWDPRGMNNRRPYCTHGLKESQDVPLLLNALTERTGKKDAVIVGVGQGYGAALLLQAAPEEPRIRGLVSLDAYASLRESVQRTFLPQSLFSQVTLALMDLKFNNTVGLNSFDVAPVERASAISRTVPVLVINMEQDNPVSNLKDALTIFKRLKSDARAVWTLRNEQDAPDAEERTETFTQGSGEKARKAEVKVRLLKDADAVMTAMIHWLDETVVPAVRAPRVADPDRPLLKPDVTL